MTCGKVRKQVNFATVTGKMSLTQGALEVLVERLDIFQSEPK